VIYHFTKYRILYLDFDGVLHDEEVYWDAKRGIYLSTPNRILFEWVDILERLVEKHADVRIVLSTSWVPIKSFNYAKRCLSPLLQSLVIGSTYHSKYMRRDEFMSLPRGVQIIQDVFRRKTELWLAIDDDYIGWPVSSRKNLICTDGSQGINARDVQCAIAQWLKKTS
jgi:hypothetical protein